MKISNETKVGVLTIIALTILILGFNFLKGKDVLKKRKKIYAVFKDLGSLAKSNEVKINGYVIGSVYEIRAKDKDLSGLVATINLTENVNIPIDSKAMISTPLVGGSYIVIQKGKDSLNFLKPGDTLSTFVDVGILDDVKAQLTPTLAKVRVTLDTLNRVMRNVNDLFTAEAKINIQQTLSNLNRASNSLNGLIDNESSALSKTLSNAEEITRTIKANTEDVTATIKNARLTSEKLAALSLQPTVDSLNSVIHTLKSVADKLNTNQGTFGGLVNDRAIYNKIYDAILSAEVLLDDLRTHPKRYVNLSIFGRKDKDGALSSPLPKDTTRH
jgi:phospholipid/cholesterol/gamma-HCH transport system substrate-binding protein